VKRNHRVVPAPSPGRAPRPSPTQTRIISTSKSPRPIFPLSPAFAGPPRRRRASSVCMRTKKKKFAANARCVLQSSKAEFHGGGVAVTCFKTSLLPLLATHLYIARIQLLSRNSNVNTQPAYMSGTHASPLRRSAIHDNPFAVCQRRPSQRAKPVCRRQLPRLLPQNPRSKIAAVWTSSVKKPAAAAKRTVIPLCRHRLPEKDNSPGHAKGCAPANRQGAHRNSGDKRDARTHPPDQTSGPFFAGVIRIACRTSSVTATPLDSRQPSVVNFVALEESFCGRKRAPFMGSAAGSSSVLQMPVPQRPAHRCAPPRSPWPSLQSRCHVSRERQQARPASARRRMRTA